MHAVLIVVLTLAALAGILFGTDHLDRRLTRNAHRRGVPLPRQARAGRTRRRRACDRRRDAELAGPEPVTHGRTAGPHGPIPIPTRSRPV